jgi:ketosteroid isomerase-like protein
LAAIQQRDLPAFLATLTTQPDLNLILPNGRLFRQRDAVVDFTRQWFADPDWRIQFDLLRTVESSKMALALLSVTYDDLDASGQPYRLQYYLSLVFAQEAGAWRLVHDQNTLLEST